MSRGKEFQVRKKYLPRASLGLEARALLMKWGADRRAGVENAADQWLRHNLTELQKDMLRLHYIEALSWDETGGALYLPKDYLLDMMRKKIVPKIVVALAGGEL